jgi:hypothetical protein
MAHELAILLMAGETIYATKKGAEQSAPFHLFAIGVDLSGKDSRIGAMGYEIAINKAWEDIGKLKPGKRLSVKFLADEYTVDCENKKLVSLACNVPAKDFAAILILHYLAKKLGGLAAPTGEWLDFKEISGVEGYADAFRQRSIEPVIRKYGKNPQGLLTALERLPGKKADKGDVGVVLEAFEGVPVMVLMWKADEEFGPEANLLFDKSITGIFCTEDIVVLAGMLASCL